jgi:hypothetical protein
MDDRSDPNAEWKPTTSDAERLVSGAPRPKPVAPEAGPLDVESLDYYELKPLHEPHAPARSRPPFSTDGYAVAPAEGADRVEVWSPAAPPRPPVDPAVAVRQVWSRRAEWGGTLVFLGTVAAIILTAFSWLISNEEFGLAFLVLFSGGFLIVLFSYPILVTLEIPVRVTPEQAARDFYGAMSHHLPHYRRMWLLLSAAGRHSGSFGSFESFRRYWKRRLRELRAGHASRLTPLKFQVEDFQSPRSSGKTEIQATYTLRIYVRGRQQAGPISTFQVHASLVRGPDRMWYLDDGTLP